MLKAGDTRNLDEKLNVALVNVVVAVPTDPPTTTTTTTTPAPDDDSKENLYFILMIVFVCLFGLLLLLVLLTPLLLKCCRSPTEIYRDKLLELLSLLSPISGQTKFWESRGQSVGKLHSRGPEFLLPTPPLNLILTFTSW